MRLRPFHLLVLIIVFILIKHRFVFAGRKFFLKKLLKGAVLASLIRPNYVPIPIPVPMMGIGTHHPGSQHLTGHLNTPHLPFSMPHPEPWHSISRHYNYIHHLPELPFNQWTGWSNGFLNNELQASMKSPMIVQPPSSISNSLTSNIPFSNFNQEPSSISNNRLANDLQSSFSSNLPLLDNLVFTRNDPLESLSARASTSNYSFRKLFKKNLKKT